MATIIEVKCSENDRIYYCTVEENVQLNKGSTVIVEVDDCLYLAQVTGVLPKDATQKNNSQNALFIRIATKSDEILSNKMIEKAKKAIPNIENSIKKYNLDMKVIEVRYSLDGKKLLIIYTAENRVDFRELVRELASIFKTRIELRQIGARDEAKLCGGYGPCGRELCCKRFIDDYKPVTIKMAKAQGLALNPNKINGICGKLMCCLEYEYQNYKEIQAKMPPLNSKIKTKSGQEGDVAFHDILKQTVTIKTQKEDSVEFVEISLEEIIS